MISLPSISTQVLVAAASTKKSTSGGSTEFLIFLVLIAVVAYFLLLRPQRQKARRQQSLQSDIAVGDEILTIGGIVGTVLTIDAERVTIVTGLDAGETGEPVHPPHRMVLLRSAIARKVDPVVAPQDDGIAGTGFDEDGHWGSDADEYDEYHDDTADESAEGVEDAEDAYDESDGADGEGAADGESHETGGQGRTEGGSREGRSP